jgi:hypothetical protein
MTSRPPPPTSKAPVSRETVEVVRKKISAPSGPPPAGMMNFSAPKSVPVSKRASSSRQYEDEDEDYEGEEQDNYRRRDSHSQPNSGRSRQGNYEYEYESRGNNRYRDDGEDDYDHNDREQEREKYQRRANEAKGEERGRGGRQHYRDQEEDRDVDNGQEEEEGEEYDDQDRQDEEQEEENDRNYHEQHRTDKNGRRMKPMTSDSPDLKSNNREREREADSKTTINSYNSSAGHQYNDSHHHQTRVELGAKESHSATLGPPSMTNPNSTSNNPSGKGQKYSVYSFQRLLSSTYRELKNFVMNPAPVGTTVRCYIERNRSGSMFLAPFYSLCADLEGE